MIYTGNIYSQVGYVFCDMGFVYLLNTVFYINAVAIRHGPNGSFCYLTCVIVCLLLALPDGTEAEVDLRLYKNAENEKATERKQVN